MDESITDRIKSTIQEVIGVPTKELTSKTRFARDLGMDSLDLTDLAMTIEFYFHFKVVDAEFQEIETVGQLIDYVQQKVGGG